MWGGELNKYIVLFVSFGWSVYKGLDVIVELSKLLPNNVISIHRTQNQKELAELYTAATVFANPTREEMFGMVNIEALACGTPVVTFRTGGSPECIDDKSGIIVEKDAIDEMKDAIVQVCEEQKFARKDCEKRAQKFEGIKKYGEYIELYEYIG